MSCRDYADHASVKEVQDVPPVEKRGVGLTQKMEGG